MSAVSTCKAKLPEGLKQGHGERENLGMTFASLFMSRVERQVSRYKNETTKWEKALKIRRLLPKSKHVHKYDQRLADCH